MQRSIIIITGICIFSLFAFVSLYLAQKDIESRKYSQTAKPTEIVADENAKTDTLETIPPVTAPASDYQEYSLQQQYEAPQTPSKSDDVPAEFHAVEMVENNMPESIEFWTQAYCPDTGSAFEYRVPQGYRVESCDYGEIGSHNGCPYCTMAKIKLVAGGEKIDSENGMCGAAIEQNYDYEPSVDLCSQGTAKGINCYMDEGEDCKWCWSCGTGAGKTTCCERGRK